MIKISSPVIAAELDPNGAQLHSLRDRSGRDFLWHGDPKVWAGRAPILFPIVGMLNGGKFRMGSREYSLARHGFARGSIFDVVQNNPSTVVFRLRSSEATLPVYPFRFQLEMRYQVEGSTLSVLASIRNDGKERMPASLGYHPGFLWPLPSGQSRSSHFIEFETDEPAPIRRIDAQGLLSPQSHPTPIKNRRLMLDDALFEDDVIILDDFKSRRVLYGAESGPKVEIGFPDAKYLGLWTKPGAPFICIEPWQGITDPSGFAADIFDKPGIFAIAPGDSHSFGMTIAIRE